MDITVRGRTDGTVPSKRDGVIELNAEETWIVEGQRELVTAVMNALPSSVSERLSERLLLLDFGNDVGWYVAGPLGKLNVRTGKWSNEDYDRLLQLISEQAAALPFSAGTPSSLPFEQAVLAHEHVLYQAFAYLRHALTRDRRSANALIPALEDILRDPDRRLTRTGRVVPTEEARHVDPRVLGDVVARRWPLVRVSQGGGPLAKALSGFMPLMIEESVAVTSFDTLENRFVKAFLDLALSVIERMRRKAVTLKGAYAREKIVREATMMNGTISAVRRASLFHDVGRMSLLPFSSSVLAHSQPYRAVFRHYACLRLGSRLPLDARTAEALLEAKDIALLYEMWSYFAVIGAITDVLGEKPAHVESAETDDLQARVERGSAALWRSGVQVTYNASFSRRQVGRRSYSMTLRPDLTVTIPDQLPNAGVHLLDAKFKVKWLERELDELDEDDAGEREGVFKHADIYKMHAYRDAIPGSRSVWILYPGTRTRFFPTEGAVITEPGLLRGALRGVGAIPLGVGDLGALRSLMRALLSR